MAKNKKKAKLVYSAPIVKKVLAVHPWYANLIVPTKELELSLREKCNVGSKTLELRTQPVKFHKRAFNRGQRIEIYATQVSEQTRSATKTKKILQYYKNLGIIEEYKELLKGAGRIIGSVALHDCFEYTRYADWRDKFKEEKYHHLYPLYLFDEELGDPDHLYGWKLQNPERYEPPIDYDFKGQVWNKRHAEPQDRWWD